MSDFTIVCKGRVSWFTTGTGRMYSVSEKRAERLGDDPRAVSILSTFPSEIDVRMGWKPGQK